MAEAGMDRRRDGIAAAPPASDLLPRMSYLSYLPAVYQEDEKSRSFLERYLSLFATLMEDMDETIAGIARYFDPEAVDGPYLRWLATWLGLSPEEHWTEQQLRLWMREAPYLYRYRGTRAAISRMVEIYTGEPPLIIEHFQIRHLLENAEFRETASRLYSDDPYAFCVLVKPEHAPSDKHQYILQRLIDAQKPAFTDARLIVLEPWMNMDAHTYLGINTTLTEPSYLKLDRHATLPYHTMLIDVDRDNRMDLHTRLGLDSELE
ncbi:phage tail protein [Paenibacillus sp. P26]|nr:phage tail protein [Paenibacillus sp. P26]